MKYIMRWGLMRNQMQENIAEHSQQCAVIAHCLATIGKKRLHRDADMAKVLAYANFHEAAEVITGDLATPIKYFSPDITRAYKNIENIATDKLLLMLPEYMRGEYAEILRPDTASLEWKYVKAADKLCAYLKCVEEKKAGNHEFDLALQRIEEDLQASDLPEMPIFFEEFAPGFSLTLDELNAPEKENG